MEVDQVALVGVDYSLKESDLQGEEGNRMVPVWE